MTGNSKNEKTGASLEQKKPSNSNSSSSKRSKSDGSSSNKNGKVKKGSTDSCPHAVDNKLMNVLMRKTKRNSLSLDCLKNCCVFLRLFVKFSLVIVLANFASLVVNHRFICYSFLDVPHLHDSHFTETAGRCFKICSDSTV